MNTKNINSGRYFRIDITTDSSGRTSIIVKENPSTMSQKTIVDVELPSKSGEFKDSFIASVEVAEGIEVKPQK